MIPNYNMPTRSSVKTVMNNDNSEKSEDEFNRKMKRMRLSTFKAENKHLKRELAKQNKIAKLIQNSRVLRDRLAELEFDNKNAVK